MASAATSASERKELKISIDHDQHHQKRDTIEPSAQFSNAPDEKPSFDTDNCECICIKCNQWFKSLSALEHHDSTSHKGVQLFKCSYCSEIFMDINMLKTHEIEHMQATAIQNHDLNYNDEHTVDFLRNKDVFVADKQTVVNTSSISKINVGQVIPGLDTKDKNTSEMRGVVANSSHSFPMIIDTAIPDVNHQTQSDPNPSSHINKSIPTTEANISGEEQKLVFTCHVCHKTFARKSYLQIHMNNHMDEKDKPFQCHLCVKGFSLKINLESHIRVHTGERPFQCEMCDKAFTSRSNLHNHLRTHTKERPFKCEVCHKGFTQKCHLQTHYRSHSGEKPFVCDICGKAFSIQSNLQGHLRKHNNERPYKCTYCPKAFTMKSNLRCHLRMHTGERPFSCNHCDKAFCQKSNLIIHLRSHTGEKPFVCTICNKAFAMKGTMQHHVKSVHGPPKQEIKKEPELYCRVCHLIYDDMDSLKKHELNHLQSTKS